MNQETDYEESQEAKLSQLIKEVQDSDESHDDTEQAVANQEPSIKEDVDILNLPPRKVVHEQHKKPFKIKFSLRLLRFVVVLAVVLCLLIVSWWLLGWEMPGNSINRQFFNAVVPVGQSSFLFLQHLILQQFLMM